MDLIGIIFIAGIAQALFFITILSLRKDNLPANRLMAIWLLLISFSLFINYLYLSGLIKKFPHFTGLDNPFPFLNPPFIFVYTKLMTQKKQVIKKQDFFHTIPFLACFIYFFISFYLKNGDYKYNYLKALQFGPIPIKLQIINYLKIFQAAIYLVLILRILQKHQNNINAEFSYTEKINLKWLKIIVSGLIVIYIFKFLGMCAITFLNNFDFKNLRSITDILIILFIYFIAFYGFKQPEIFVKVNADNPASRNGNSTNDLFADNSQEKLKYINSPLSSVDCEKIAFRLQEYMTTEKPYLKSQLSINDIAEELDINTKYLSQVINQQTGMNFFNFVNQYRIEEVKKRLRDKKYQHLSILGIALECGFNSKSSFNSIFKKFTNQTPTSYISGTSKFIT